MLCFPSLVGMKRNSVFNSNPTCVGAEGVKVIFTSALRLIRTYVLSRTWPAGYVGTPERMSSKWLLVLALALSCRCHRMTSSHYYPFRRNLSRLGYWVLNDSLTSERGGVGTRQGSRCEAKRETQCGGISRPLCETALH